METAERKRKMEEHKKIVADLTVRFRDIDAMGHVNNAVFFTTRLSRSMRSLWKASGITARSRKGRHPFCVMTDHRPCPRAAGRRGGGKEDGERKGIKARNTRA
jgi:hypothetical protein